MPNFINDCKNINQYTPVETYRFDFSTIAPRFFDQATSYARISNHRQSNGSDLVMNGVTYNHCAVKIEGVTSEINSNPTNPQLTVDRTTFDGLTSVTALRTSWRTLGNLPPFPLRGTVIQRMVTLFDYNSDPLWTMSDRHGLSTFSITAGGTGYTSVPTVTVNSGVGAGGVVQAEISGGSVSDLTVVARGHYEEIPTLTITGGGGSGATATVTALATGLTSGPTSPYGYRTGTDVLKSGVLSQYVINNILDMTEKHYIFELSPSLELLDNQTDTNRKMPAGLCSLKYRNYINGSFQYTPVADGGCPYGQQTNGDSGYSVTNYFDRNNTSTTDASKDYCSKNIIGCRARWAAGSATSPLPFMGQFRAGTPGTKTNERD